MTAPLATLESLDVLDGSIQELTSRDARRWRTPDEDMVSFTIAQPRPADLDSRDARIDLHVVAGRGIHVSST
jgi:hypothetical protein